MTREAWILNAVKEITIAEISSSSSNLVVCQDSGEAVSEFMDAVFDGLCEIVKKLDSQD